MDPEKSADEATASGGQKKKLTYPGPDPKVKYPISVFYCGECGLPVDLCDYSPNPEGCKDWLNKNHPDFNSKLNNLQIGDSNEASGGANDDDADKKSAHQKRGGKGMPKAKKEKVPSRVTITKNQRKGNKSVTIITGLGANDIDLEVAKKFFAQKYCCGCSKGDNDDLTIQGDVVDNLYKLIQEKYPQITKDMIEIKEK